MKKLLLISVITTLLCFSCFVTKAQSPRLQLFEYFDNTSIPPFGAVANAHFDSIANANTSKMTFIKYHIYFGSQDNTDPMNLQDPTQALTRFNYYKDSSDPTAHQDGSVFADSTFNGQPSNLSQSYINLRDTVSSPYTISVSHQLNAGGDSILTHTVITKTDSVTGVPVVYVVVIEKLIHFLTAPGESGDTYFRNVMKQMLPTASGTLLPTMYVGDSVVYNLSWKLACVRHL